MKTALTGVLVILAISTTLLLAAIGWPGRVYRDSDFFQYYAGAAALASGVSPYDTQWWTDFSARHGSNALHGPPQPASGDPAWTTPYPLYLFVAILPIQFMPFDLAAASWLVGQVASLAAGLVFVARHLLTQRRRDGLVLAAITVGFQPVWLLPGNGNLTGFLFGAIAGAIGMTLRGRYFAAGAFLAVAAVKPQSLVLIAFALFIAARPPDRLRLLMGAAVVGLPFALVAFALQPSWLARWLASVAALQQTHFSNATGWTIDRVMPGTPAVAAPVAVVAALVIFGAWWWRARPAPVWAIAAAVPISVFVSAHGWTYEQLYLLIPATVVIAAVADAAPRMRTIVLVAVVLAFGLVPWVLYVWDLSRNGEEPSAAVPLLVFGVVLLVHWLRRGWEQSDFDARPPTTGIAEDSDHDPDGVVRSGWSRRARRQHPLGRA